MDFTRLMVAEEQPTVATERWSYFQDKSRPSTYWSNYLLYEVLPSLAEFEADVAWIKEQQSGYERTYVHVFFPDQADLSEELTAYMATEDYEVTKHLVMTAPVSALKLADKPLDGIAIVELSEELLPLYQDYRYQQRLVFGQDYAEEARQADQTILEEDCRIFLALHEGRIIGDVTGWYFGDYAEIDDFRVDEVFRGRGIGSQLQRAAIGDCQQVILLAEEENQQMYQHQGYQVASYHYNVLKEWE